MSFGMSQSKKLVTMNKKILPTYLLKPLTYTHLLLLSLLTYLAYTRLFILAKPNLK
jgi:hypothetical protein